LVYSLFFVNQFICLDTTLNVIYTGHTIDTVSHFGNKVGSLQIGPHSEGLTNTLPLHITNWESCVWSGKLYVNSMLPAENEQPNAFAKQSVIDVYNLRGGIYEGSFYLPDIDGERLVNFRIMDNIVIEITKHYVATCRIKPSRHVALL
jgi:hypothetical protein